MPKLKDSLDINGKENTKFWISHLIVLLGTVMGVFLAASAGLKSAVQFELIKSDRDSYYMRSALLDELADNMEKVTKWGGEYQSGNARKFIGNTNDFNLDTYVWTTMQESPGTFEIPSKILTQVRRYYTNTEINLRKMTGKGPAAEQVQVMLEETKAMSREAIPLLKQDIQQLVEKLDKVGVSLVKITR